MKSGHPQRKHELEHGNENLWEINHEVLALEVLWNPLGLCNRVEAAIGFCKDHYFVKFQNSSNSMDSKVRCAVCAVRFSIFVEKSQCKKKKIPSLKWNCGEKQCHETNVKLNCTKEKCFLAWMYLRNPQGVWRDPQCFKQHSSIIEVDGLFGVYHYNGKEER